MLYLNSTFTTLINLYHSNCIGQYRVRLETKNHNYVRTAVKEEEEEEEPNYIVYTVHVSISRLIS